MTKEIQNDEIQKRWAAAAAICHSDFIIDSSFDSRAS
jgi:hypothetical protein